MTDKLLFDEKTHAYTLEGRILPSVTGLMKPLRDDVYSNVAPEVMEKAAERGTEVHSAIENYIKYGIEDISPENAGYFEGFKKWEHDFRVKPIGSEYRLYHPLLFYAGTADLLAVVDGKMSLVDFKTTSAVNEMLCGVQLEAYERAFEAMGNGLQQQTIEQKIILHLNNDRKYEGLIFKTKDTECWRVFTALLTVNNYKQKFRNK